MSLPSMRLSDVFNASFGTVFALSFSIGTSIRNCKVVQLCEPGAKNTKMSIYKEACNTWIHFVQSSLTNTCHDSLLLQVFHSPDCSFRFGRPLNLLGTFAFSQPDPDSCGLGHGTLPLKFESAALFQHLLRLQGNAFRKVKWCNGASPYVWKVVVMPVLRQSRRPSMEKRTAKEAKYCVPGQRPFLRFIQGAHEASLKIRGIICLP